MKMHRPSRLLIPSWVRICFQINRVSAVVPKEYIKLLQFSTTNTNFTLPFYATNSPIECACLCAWFSFNLPAAVARSEACSLGMQAASSSIPTSGTFFRGGLVIKTFLRPISLFRWFKKSSCQLLAKECALCTGKLPRRLAQEQCG